MADLFAKRCGDGEVTSTHELHVSVAASTPT